MDKIKPFGNLEGFGDNTFWIITEADYGVTAFLLPKIIKADAGA
jgi:hypothetical protein